MRWPSALYRLNHSLADGRSGHCHAVLGTCDLLPSSQFCRRFSWTVEGLTVPIERLAVVPGEAAMAVVLGMLDEHQGQVNGNFCADEVFCGRNPNRGTETCTVVEQVRSLESNVQCPYPEHR